ncbi:MAG TPA: aminotransferase class IV [Phycisphaerae bacterium]|nr:aminotransferase class IV [Phycisphaerae bacterium]HRY66957.1 aminotransferase class IV [Phycisphaerae bacterium]HSA27905.1 aminotransferase class IV [Phycisphaerae bacterium]
MGTKVYLNGRIVEMGEAAVPVSNPALLHGVGLFETVRAYGGRPFRLGRHVHRMLASAERLNMSIGQVSEQVPAAVRQVLEANRLGEARVRFTVTPPAPQEPDAGPNLLVMAQELAGYPDGLYERGMTVYVCDQYRQSVQDPLAGHKTTSYFPRLLVLRNAQDRACGEGLWFTPENLLAEGCMSNVFLIKDGCLATPPLNTPVLPGVTRAAILELAGQEGIPAEESPRTIRDLLEADEVFLTNAIMEVMPVTRVERKAIAGERPGPLTQRLARGYRELVLSTAADS